MDNVICVHCNSYLGHEVDAFLHRESPEAVLQAVAGLKASDKGSPFYTMRDGEPVMRLLGNEPGRDEEILLEAGGETSGVNIARQLVFRWADGTPVLVPLPSNIRTS